MPAPTNVTPATAIDITTLPYDINLDVTALAAPFTVWWKRTITADDVMLGFFAYPSTAIAYNPKISFWTTALSSPSAYPSINPLIIPPDTPGQLPVNAGDTIWMKIEDTTGGAVPGILVFGARPSPNSAAPIGSLFVNDDTEQWFASILDATTGAVIRQARTTVGEEGAIFDSGQMVLQNDDALSEGAKLYLYAANLNLITTLALGSPEVTMNTNGPLLYTSERIGVTANVNIKTYDTSLVLQNTFLLTANRPACMAVSKDNSEIYFNRGSINNPIQKMVLGTLVVTDLVTAPASNHMEKQCLQVLSDGTILASWISGSTFLIRAYNSSGAQINSYSFTLSNRTDGPRLAIAQDDPNSFWVWASSLSAGVRSSKFQRIKVSDGSTLASFTVDVFESGLGVPVASGITEPVQKFGNSKSCPFLVTRVSLAPVTPDLSGVYFMNDNSATAPTHDVYNTTTKKIPNPTIRTALIGE
jgi:hypothetical protein